jgi:hypothetical protein
MVPMGTILMFSVAADAMSLRAWRPTKSHVTFPAGPVFGLRPYYEMLVCGETVASRCICFGVLVYRRKMSAYPVGNFLFQGFGDDF